MREEKRKRIRAELKKLKTSIAEHLKSHKGQVESVVMEKIIHILDNKPSRSRVQNECKEKVRCPMCKHILTRLAMVRRKHGLEDAKSILPRSYVQQMKKG